MIIEYHRPEKLDDALALLQRATPKTLPLGGGTVLNSPADDKFAVVDLQQLELTSLEAKGSNALEIGATATLQALYEQADVPEALKTAIHREANYTLRQTATVAGSMVSADGRSAFAAAMLALDAQLTLLPDEEVKGYGEVLPLRGEALKGRLITKLSIPLNVKLAYDYVARSPADLPVVCVAVAYWPSGRTRVVTGGWGAAPNVAMDGQGTEGAAEAVSNALSHASDEWATAEYRVKAGQAIVERLISEVSEN
ncbi:MAG: hypothetical protein DWQ07_06325 [Chloroflexi bacterium]|nr:MAG: hypothetical protein DWQ07_06325 [Chloroflexota bacterium]MBL1195955.1 hypothetical protein [Chloroflexota bacterium]NOH13249.1 hypothetical protein [Chloroflexota bacterium]